MQAIEIHHLPCLAQMRNEVLSDLVVIMLHVCTTEHLPFSQ